MKQQPGVMLYFDVRESIAQLSYAEKGMLLDAILDYGQHRQEPTFDGVALPLIWPFVRKDIHRDSERYEARRQAGLKGAHNRWNNEAKETDSKAMANDGKDMANDSKPMANMPTTPSPTPSPSAAAAPPTAAAATETETASTAPAASPLPRTNGSALPDIVAQYLPGRRSPQEEVDRRRAEAIAKLRALPDS